MIEHLTKLNAASSGAMAEMQGKPPRRTADEQAHAEAMKAAATSQKCLACNGKKGASVRGLWYWCQRCAGTGRRRDESRRKSSRSKVPPDGITSQAVGFMVAGMPDYWLLAAKVMVLRDAHSIRPLQQAAVLRLVEPASREWRLEDKDRQIRIEGMAKLAVHSLLLPEGELLVNSTAATIMGCNVRNWQARWLARNKTIASQMEGWVSSADDYMKWRWYEKLVA